LNLEDEMIEGSLVPNITFFDQKGRLDLEKTKWHMRWMFERGVDGLFLTGSYGSDPMISLDERNIIFFAKYQVLFANGTAFEKLSDAQHNIIREAAAATQKKAIAEHLSDADAAKAWCADGGSIVLASDEQITAFEKAAQPVLDQIAQNPFNAAMIASIREMKVKTKPYRGVEACASQTAQQNAAPNAEDEVWSPGLSPNGIWQMELTTDDFIKMGALKSTADDMAGIYTWTFQDGQAKIEIHGPRITVSCMVVATVVGNVIRLQNVASPDCDGNAYDDVQWRLDTDGLHFHLVSSQAVELKTMYESKPWKKIVGNSLTEGLSMATGGKRIVFHLLIINWII